MTILNRITRLCKADLHGILDTLEEPGLVLRQALREMEEELAKGEEEHKDIERKKERIKEAKLQCEKALAEANEQIELSFNSGNEELSKVFVRKKLETQKRLLSIEQNYSALEKEERVLLAQLASQREQRAQIVERVELLGVCATEQRWPKKGGCSTEMIVSDEEVEVAYLAEQKRRVTNEKSR